MLYAASLPAFAMEFTDQTQPNFVTCWQVSQICKRPSKILGVLADNWEVKNWLFGDSFQLDKTIREYEMPKIGPEFLPTLRINACYDYGTGA